MAMTEWKQYFPDEDPDTILNRIDEGIEQEDYADRLEGMLDLLEERPVERSMMMSLARSLLEYAEQQE